MAVTGKQYYAPSRLTNLEITNKSFILPKDVIVEETYRYCFGIICPTNQKPEEIILSFNPIQGKYIKSLPLHHSQEILIDNNKELQIKLTLFVTYDLVKKLLSFGEYMKVIQPATLIDEIANALKLANLQYN